MKKILCLVIAIMLMLTCVGCENEGNDIITDGRFMVIEDGFADSGRVCVVVDKETNVMYLKYHYGITVMLDADGKPLLWEENNNEK